MGRVYGKMYRWSCQNQKWFSVGVVRNWGASDANRHMVATRVDLNEVTSIADGYCMHLVRLCTPHSGMRHGL